MLKKNRRIAMVGGGMRDMDGLKPLCARDDIDINERGKPRRFLGTVQQRF